MEYFFVDDVVVVLLEQPTNKSAVDNAVIFNVEIKFISFPFFNYQNIALFA